MPTTDFDKLWDYGDPKSTEEKFRALLPEFEASDDRALLAELFTQIARTQGLQDRFDDAHATLDRVRKMLTDETRRARLRYFLERGRVFNSSGRVGEALIYFLKAADFSKGIGEIQLQIDAIHMVAIAQPAYEQQIAWNLKGIEIAREHSEEKGWLYALYNNLGEVYAASGDDARALETFEKLVALDVDRGREPNLYTQKDVAKFLRRIGRIDEAMKILRPLEAKLAKDGKRNGYIEMEIAQCLLDQSKPDEARGHCAEAYRQLANDPWLNELDKAALERMKKNATVS